ncbi:Uma2 family endonuclease [Sphingomonas sp.]|uniref:Uma2 family endonuclease n=1 Tax=Sphingomonas sp. TaxID=28214 RepID=UPI0035BC49B4
MNVMAPISPPVTDDPQFFKLRIEDYELLDRAGVFHGQRVELIGGRIVVVNAQFQAHFIVKNRLGRRLQAALEAIGSKHEAMIEGSVALSDSDLPDPDILVGTVSPVRDYVRIGQVAMIVEIADTSIRHDLGEKRDLYAVSRVPEYWVVDINARQVHQFWAVEKVRYLETRVVPLDGELRSATMPDLAIDGSGIL